MESLKTMHIKRFVAHLLTFRHTVYYRIWFFCRPFRRTGREHHKTSDKPPPAGVGSRDGLLYVYHTADCSPLWCVAGCVVLYRTQRRPLVRCRSPPNVQDSQKFLNDLEDKTMRYRNNGQIEEELQIRFTGYLIQAVKRTRRDYLNMLNQYSNSEILTDTTYTTGQTLEQEVTFPPRIAEAFLTAGGCSARIAQGTADPNRSYNIGKTALGRSSVCIVPERSSASAYRFP